MDGHGEFLLAIFGSKNFIYGYADAKDFIPANLGIGTTYTKVFNEQNKQ